MPRPPFPPPFSAPKTSRGKTLAAPQALCRAPPHAPPNPNPNPPRAAAASQFEIGVSDKGVIYGKLQFRQKMQQWILLRVEPREWQSLQLE